VSGHDQGTDTMIARLGALVQTTTRLLLENRFYRGQTEAQVDAAPGD